MDSLPDDAPIMDEQVDKHINELTNVELIELLDKLAAEME